MKKIIWPIVLILISFVFIYGCENLTGSSLSPPSWIIGTWSDVSEAITFIFNNDNVIMTSSTTVLNFKEIYKVDNISDSGNASKYTINTTDIDGTKGTYEFIKVTDTSLNYTITTNGTSIGPILLYKKLG